MYGECFLASGSPVFLWDSGKTSFEANIKGPHFRLFANVKTGRDGFLHLPVTAAGGYCLFPPSFYSDKGYSRTQIFQCPQGPTQLLISPLFIFQNRRGKAEFRDKGCG